MDRPPRRSTLFPYTTLFRSKDGELFTHPADNYILSGITRKKIIQLCETLGIKVNEETFTVDDMLDRKSTRLNSSHVATSCAVCCLKKTTSGTWSIRARASQS